MSRQQVSFFPVCAWLHFIWLCLRACICWLIRSKRSVYFFNWDSNLAVASFARFYRSAINLSIYFSHLSIFFLSRKHSYYSYYSCCYLFSDKLEQDLFKSDNYPVSYFSFIYFCSASLLALSIYGLRSGIFWGLEACYIYLSIFFISLSIY